MNKNPLSLHYQKVPMMAEIWNNMKEINQQRFNLIVL